MKFIAKTALAVAGMAVATSSFAAVDKLDFHVRKIELFADGTDTTAGVVTVYEQPTATKGNVDLLAAGTKSGVNLGITPPPAGVYKAMAVYIDRFVGVDNATGDDVGADLAATLAGTGLFGTDAVSGDAVVYYTNNGGDVDAIGGDDSDLASLFQKLPAGPMTPISYTSGILRLPTLDIQLPAAAVAQQGAAGTSATVLTSLPKPRLKKATAGDDANIYDVPVKVNFTNSQGLVEDNSATIGAFKTGNTRRIAVGLFENGKGTISSTPEYVTSKVITASAAGEIADSSFTVELTDVADGTYTPMAWVDTDADGVLDAGEYVSAATLGTVTGGAATTNYACVDNNVGIITMTDEDQTDDYAAAVTKGDVTNTCLGADPFGIPDVAGATAHKFRGTDVTVKIAMPVGVDAAGAVATVMSENTLSTVSGLQATHALASSNLDTGAVSTQTVGSLELTSGLGVISVPVVWGDSNNRNGGVACTTPVDDQFDTCGAGTELLNAALGVSDTTTVVGASYDASNSQLVLTVPLATVTAIGANNTEGAYSYDITSTVCTTDCLTGNAARVAATIDETGTGAITTDNVVTYAGSGANEVVGGNLANF